MRLRIVENGMQKWVDKITKRASPPDLRAWLNRYAYPQLLNVQLRRWQTEGASEGKKWAPLKPDYAKRKQTKFAAYPGGGRKMLIATARLVGSMSKTGHPDHRKMVTGNRLQLSSTVPYGEYINEGTKNMPARDITTLSDATVKKFANELLKYLLGGG